MNWPDVTPEFGNWLAGFIDGEGCFRVQKAKHGTYYSCPFSLKVRDDDANIIREIIRRTGIGYAKPDGGQGRVNPCIVWYVNSKKNCLKLVKLLDEYPLRAKKHRDYRISREAVICWSKLQRGNRRSGPTDWTAMIELKEQIEKVREYVPDNENRREIDAIADRRLQSSCATKNDTLPLIFLQR